MTENLKTCIEHALLDNIPYSNDFIVLYIIHTLSNGGEKVWLSKIVNVLGGKVTKNEVVHAIDNLSMWGIVHGEYGDTGEGHACTLYCIDAGHSDSISAIMTKIDELLRK